MKLKMILSSMFRWGNLAILFTGLIAAAILSDGSITAYVSGAVLYAAAVGLYALGVFSSLFSKKFHEEFNQKEKLKLIRSLDRDCQRLFYEARKQLAPQQHQKLKKVIEDKNEILKSYFRGEKGYIKEKITEQTLKLVIAYIRLLTNYCARSKELARVNLTEVANRISMNLRKLNFAKDPHTTEDIKKVVEMDETLIKNLKEEKVELERIGAKLEYMEGSVNMFKHQVLSSIESEEMLEKIETAVNEVSALDSVLQERRRNRIR